jgi:hypothetical protein
MVVNAFVSVASKGGCSNLPENPLAKRGFDEGCCGTEEGLEVCKRLRHEDVRDPVLVLGADLMLCMLKLLDVRSLARASVLSKKWKAVVHNDTLWLPKVCIHAAFQAAMNNSCI